MSIQLDTAYIGYAVSSFLDTAYWSEISNLQISSFKLQKVRLLAYLHKSLLTLFDVINDDENPPAGPNQGKKTKRRRTKESESSKKSFTTKETPQGKAPSKGSKTGKFASVKEPVEEPIAEVVMDDASEDVVRDDDQPQDTSEPTMTLELRRNK
ncbi:hypothetical protein Tco_0772510 [Tanacetum coccineum]|uniref:Uncharacterized protein n=1 Tax=Tanacetum coccineum TaxID=301880 RepID=A0ABQ4ZI35_9ASTR